MARVLTSDEPNNAPRELTAATRTIRQSARDLGFDACAIATAAPADPHDRLGQWLRQGYHADMEWMAISKAVRQDVTRKLPHAQSVVVVARNYFSGDIPEQPDCGRVARYAWGRDYHRVLKKPLKLLAESIIEQCPGAKYYCSIDSGPVLERTWAERAGLGWVGKNSLILRRDLGSYFFLGVILTTAELVPDVPMPDYCGSCTACLDACPTRAIVEPKVVDARRCISYHTIENRGEIPPDLADAFGAWVFGCDICQEVCPWNRFAKITTEPAFQPRPGQNEPALRDLEALDEPTFRARYTGTPILRTKWEGLRRNARIARGNTTSK